MEGAQNPKLETHTQYSQNPLISVSSIAKFGFLKEHLSKT